MMCECYARDNQELQRSKTKVEKLLEHFDGEISKETEQFVIDTVFESSRYMFVRREVKKLKDPLTGLKIKNEKYYAYCTHCKKEYEIEEEDIGDTIKHNYHAECLECKSKCIVKFTRYRRSQLVDRALFITYAKSKVDKGTLVASGYFVMRDYSGDYKKVKTRYTGLSRYIFDSNGESTMISYWGYTGWGIRNRCCSWKDGYGNYREYVDADSIDRAVEGTRFRYSPYKAYMVYGEDMTRFFYTYNKYPIIERLVKAGFKTIADYMIDGKSLERAIKWKQTDMFKFLGINRGEAKEIKESGIRCTPRFLKLYKYCKREKLKWPLEEIEKMSFEFCVENLEQIKEYSGIQKIINYFNKQYEINQKTKECRYYGQRDVMRTWFDYIADCEKLKLDIKDKNALFPKSLYRAHQNTIKQIKYKEDKALNEKMKKLAKQREKYKFEYKDLFIRAAVTSAELIEEGKKLNHCVGGYARRHAVGEITILFIRKKEEPNKPYFTVEVRADKVIQVRGFKNSDPKEDVEKFMEEFKKQILEKSKKAKKIA